jgi:hypothetical protein
MGGHAFVKVGGIQPQYNRAHGSQVVDAQRARPKEGTRRCPDIASHHQGFDDRQFFVRRVFFHEKILTK